MNGIYVTPTDNLGLFIITESKTFERLIYSGTLVPLATLFEKTTKGPFRAVCDDEAIPAINAARVKEIS